MAALKIAGAAQNKKAGRPALSDDEKKILLVNFKCTKEEKTLLQQNAKKSGLSLSKYIMSRCL